MNNLLENRLRDDVARHMWAFGRRLITLCSILFICTSIFAQNSDMVARQRGPVTSNSTWTAFTNDTGAFSVKFPGNPFIMKRETPAMISGDSVTFLMNLYACVDSVKGTTYIARYNDYPAGTFLSEPGKLLTSFQDEFGAKGKVIGEPKKVSVDGIDGWELDVAFLQGFNGIVRFYSRGNRVYLLLKQVDKFGKLDNGPDPFLDSFHFLPFTEPAYYTYQPENRNFTVRLPGKPLVRADSALSYTSYIVGETLYFATNPNSGALYSVAASRISPYYRAGNADSIFKKTIDLMIEYRDSLVKLDTIVVNNIKGREYITVNRTTKNKERSRVFIDGENFFLLTARADESQLFDKASNVFFNSLVLTGPSRSADFASSKAEKISNDLASADTLKAKRALGALSYYDFKPDEFRFMYAALKKSYPDDTSWTGVRASLVQKFRDAGTDSTISVLTSMYPGLGDKNELKAAILYTLPRIDPKKSYDSYLKLLITDPPMKIEAYKATLGLTDSLEFAGQNFNSLLPLIKQDIYRPNLLNIAARISEGDYPEQKKNLEANYAAIMQFADADIANYLKKKDSTENEFSGPVYSYMRLMGQFKHVSLTERLTSAYLKADPKGTYGSDAIVARIFNGLPNKPELIKFYMDSLDTRYDLMKAYYGQKQLSQVPELYRRQDQFAKLCLFKYIGANDDDDGNGGVAKDIKLLGTVTKAGKMYYAFKFSVSGSDDAKTLIGIAGPYISGSQKLSFDKFHAYSSFDELKTNWRAQAEELIKPLTDANADK